MAKKSFFCGSSSVIKYGTRGLVQRFQCKTCGRTFDGGNRVRREDLVDSILSDYVEKEQTYADLSEKISQVSECHIQDCSREPAASSCCPEAQECHCPYGYDLLGLEFWTFVLLKVY